MYVACVVDAFSRRIVVWRASSCLRSELALEALEQAIWGRQDASHEGPIHHSDRGVQYLSARYSERLGESGTEPPAGSRGASYEDTPAETTIGLYKTEVIRKRVPWRGLDDVELPTFEWVWWFNHHRLLSSIEHVPPAEYEEQCQSHQTSHEEAMALT